MTFVSHLDDLEQLVLRNIRDEDHHRGVTDENRARHDQALMRLIARDLVSYNPRRRSHKFALTVQGKAALAVADVQPGALFKGQALHPAAAEALGKLFHREVNAANASMDAREAELDQHGYGGKKPGGEVVGLQTLPDLDKVVKVGLGNYFGKRDDETLGDAIERRAQEPHPMLAMIPKADPHG